MRENADQKNPEYGVGKSWIGKIICKRLKMSIVTKLYLDI